MAHQRLSFSLSFPFTLCWHLKKVPVAWTALPGRWGRRRKWILHCRHLIPGFIKTTRQSQSSLCWRPRRDYCRIKYFESCWPIVSVLWWLQNPNFDLSGSSRYSCFFFVYLYPFKSIERLLSEGWSKTKSETHPWMCETISDRALRKQLRVRSRIFLDEDVEICIILRHHDDTTT
jgi:hypothetical protein